VSGQLGDIATFNYKVEITPPSISPQPAAGKVTLPQAVTLARTNTGTEIRYTLNDTAPGPGVGTVYGSSAFNLSGGGKVKVRAVEVYTNGNYKSEEAVFEYDIVPAKPTIAPTETLQQVGSLVTLTPAAVGDVIYYTTDGSDPNLDNLDTSADQDDDSKPTKLYTAPFQLHTVKNPFTVKAVSVMAGGVSETATLAYNVAMVVNRYTVRFNSNGGSSVATQTVVEGTKATAPANPTRTPAPTRDDWFAEIIAADVGGSYQSNNTWAVVGWFLPNGTQWNFNDNVNANMVLTARWTSVTKLTYNTLQSALVWTGSASTVSIIYAMKGDETIDGATSGYGWVNVFRNFTIIGLNQERRINCNNVGNPIFGVSRQNGTLTLGNNVKVQGTGTRTKAVVELEAGTGSGTGRGGILIMLPGSKITGNVSSSSNAVITMNAYGRVEMEGGEISGNTCTATDDWLAGGFSVNGGGSNFVMRGGVIKDNKGPAHDVLVNEGVDSFTMSGNATIRGLTLSSGSAAPNPSRRYGVSVDPAWTGKIDYMFFRGSVDTWVANGAHPTSPSRVITLTGVAAAELPTSSVLLEKIGKIGKLKQFSATAADDLDTLPDLTTHEISTAANATRGNLVAK